MKPVILMAMWKRHAVVRRNVELLSLQTEPFLLVLVYSDQEDAAFCYDLARKYIFIAAIAADNFPLGRKWQVGADYCRTIGADPLIPLGSDDFLNVDFVKNACDLSKEKDFIGLIQWYCFDTSVKTIYRLMYVTPFPLGGGRIYSGRLLKKLNYKIFDEEKNHHLDDFAWEKREKHWQLIDETSVYGLAILSAKGNWDQMNPLDKILSSPNISWGKVNNIDDLMGFPVKTQLDL